MGSKEGLSKVSLEASCSSCDQYNPDFIWCELTYFSQNVYVFVATKSLLVSCSKQVLQATR